MSEPSDSGGVLPYGGDPQVRLCLAGDVMTGRGIDQILGHPGDPEIHEPWARSALDYVDLAERASGPIPRSAAPDYVWGDVLAELGAPPPDAFVVNLETAVTDRGEPWPGKGIHYRMHPDNVGCLATAGVDVAVLANNHVLDWSVPGLEQTLDTLRTTSVIAAGAGRDEDEAWSPAVVATSAGPRVVVLALGSTSSGIPPDWAASGDAPGVALLPDLSSATVERIARCVQASTRPRDVVVVSLHWGANWGHAVPREHRRFAHELIDQAGVHVVHGHSSHHPLGIEVHAGRLIVHGCGDLLTDYEGIHGHEQYRGELGALYLPTIDHTSGALVGLSLVPTKVVRFRLTRPSEEEVAWLATTLDREGRALGTTVREEQGSLVLGW